MRLISGVLGCLSACGLALADIPPTATPPAPAATQTPAAPAPAQTAASATPAAAAEKPQAQPSATNADEEREKHFVAEGYKVEMRHGEKMFCRREQELGSRLGGQKVCSTAQQLTFTEREAKETVNTSRMQSNQPSGK